MRPNKLIIHRTYHKCGTVWFKGLFRKIAQTFGWKVYTNGGFGGLPLDADMWFNPKSIKGYEALARPYAGSHMIRDPRDVVVSGYFYHIWCQETWCNTPRQNYDGKSYQELLNSVPKEEGLLLEMSRCKHVFDAMVQWDYNDPHFINVKYEDVILDPETLFPKIFQHYGLSDEQTTIALELSRRVHFTNKSGRALGQEQSKSHLRSGLPGGWKNHFSPHLLSEFHRQYPTLLQDLGYQFDTSPIAVL